MWNAGEFSSQVWELVAPIRERIDQLPLLLELAQGTLQEARFVEYIVQDDFYLRGYARALALLSSRAPHLDAAKFWASSASDAVAGEQIMHAQLLDDDRLSSLPRAEFPSPTTRAYTNFIQTNVAYEPYEIGVATVLPCYWIYADAGLKLTERAQGIEDHPYAAWVAAYADPSFQEVTEGAIALLDEAASTATDKELEAMRQAFQTATFYEEQFWAKSYEQQTWQV